MILYPDYRKAARIAIETLEIYEIPRAPVDLRIILEYLSNEVRLLTYQDYMKDSGRTLEETISDFDSELGVCTFEPITNRYIIYYNSKWSDEICHFTLAHELGHIFMEHHIRSGVNTLRRSFMRKDVYDVYEKEANVFARNLLSPAPLAQNLKDNCSQNPIAAFEVAFEITKKAAKVRFDKLKRDIEDYTSDMLNVVSKIKMSYQTVCRNCNHLVPPETKFCPFCSSSDIHYSLGHKPIPYNTQFSQDETVQHCLICGNSEIKYDANFCIICGAPIRNSCLGRISGEKHENLPYAKFCTSCGDRTAISIFLENKKEAFVEPMKYKDGVPYDPVTMKVNICPTCQNEEFSENADYCRICGTDLHNYCDGMFYDPEDGNTYQKEKHPNPSNARFCETCGRPTEFFSNKILCEYKKYQSAQDSIASQDDAPSATEEWGTWFSNNEPNKKNELEEIPF